MKIRCGKSSRRILAVALSVAMAASLCPGVAQTTLAFADDGSGTSSVAEAKGIYNADNWTPTVLRTGFTSAPESSDIFTTIRYTDSSTGTSSIVPSTAYTLEWQDAEGNALSDAPSAPGNYKLAAKASAEGYAGSKAVDFTIYDPTYFEDWQTSGTCQWRIDSDGLLTIEPTNGVAGALEEYTSFASVPWIDARDLIKKVKAEEGVRADYLGRAFYSCTNLTSADLSAMDASNATTTVGMFLFCSSLTDVTLPKFGKENPIYFQNTFRGCSSLKNVDFSFSSNVLASSTYGMFCGCSALETIDLSYIDLSKVTQAADMFSGCTNLSQIVFADGGFSAALSMERMFSNCPKLIKIPANFAIPDGASTTDLFAVGDVTAPIKTYYSGKDANVLAYDFESSGRELVADLPVISLGAATASQGEEVSIDLTLGNDCGIAAGNVIVSYDADALEFEGIDETSIPEGYLMEVNGATAGKINIVWVGKSATGADSVLGKLAFKVKDSASQGSYSITALLGSGGITNGEDLIEPDFEAGSIKVEEAVVGDVNSDGLLDTRDLVKLQRYLTGLVSLDSHQLTLADFNADGSVNMKDLVKEARYMAGFTD